MPTKRGRVPEPACYRQIVQLPSSYLPTKIHKSAYRHANFLGDLDVAVGVRLKPLIRSSRREGGQFATATRKKGR
jgi:hypothetical protein